MMDFTVKTKGVEIVKSVPVLYYYLFSCFQLYSVLWGRLHLATYMCYINF